MYTLTIKQLDYGLKGLDLGEMAVAILSDHYVKGSSVADTSKLFEVSRQYVYELERKFQTNLKKNMKRDNLTFVLALINEDAIESIRSIEGFDS